MLKFLGFMWNPLSWVMEAAAIMAIALANGGVRSVLHGIIGIYLLIMDNTKYFAHLVFVILLSNSPSFETCRVSHRIGKTLWGLWCC